ISTRRLHSSYRDRLSLPTRRSSDLLSGLGDRDSQLAAPEPNRARTLEIKAYVEGVSPSASVGDRAHRLPQRRHRASEAALRPLRSEEHTSELQSRVDLVCRLLLEKI